MNRLLHSIRNRPPAPVPASSGCGWLETCRFWRVWLAAAMAAGLGLPVTAWGQTSNVVANTVHNLSASGPGTVHALTETEICIFCHTPHFASGDGPLWNHQMSGASYTPYTLTNTVSGQPTGSSRLCLSCHDGTVALGAVNSRGTPIGMNNILPSASSLGTDLSKHHPVSFVFDNALAVKDGQLIYPPASASIPLDRTGQMQCTSCHDPHNDQYGNFLVVDNSSYGLCSDCHSPTLTGWIASQHALSAKPLSVTMASVVAQTVSAKSRAKPVSVAGAACSACHVTHGAGAENLVRFTEPEKNCELCHGSSGPGQNVMPEFSKVSVHPIYQNGRSHSPGEDLINPPERHATCVDCHNPHAVNNAAGGVSSLSGSLARVKGVGAGGAVIQTVQHEYELCFRCHGDSALRGPATVTRQFVETNTRRQFNPGTMSYHPVEAAGRNTSVPSLIAPLTTSSQIQCTDCHNNDQGPGAKGSGPKGPHGSAYAPLLERKLSLVDGLPYNPNDAALCYKCHDSRVVMNQQGASWSLHAYHVNNPDSANNNAVCTTCHDSHASSQPHLINFNTTYVTPSHGVLQYVSTGPGQGSCTLTCHNHQHNAAAYYPGSASSLLKKAGMH